MPHCDAILIGIIEDKVKTRTLKLRDLLDLRDLLSENTRWFAVKLIEDFKRLVQV